MNEIISQPYFSLYILPALICVARILDVSFGTLRIIFISKGSRLLAPLVGFFEIFIWIMAIGEVMKNLDNVTNIFAYCLGYSLGNYVGILLEERLAIGIVTMRIITKRDSSKLVNALRELNYNITITDAEGNLGAVSIIFMSLKRAKIKDVIPIIYHYNPLATYSIEDIRYVSDLTYTNPLKEKFGKFFKHK